MRKLIIAAMLAAVALAGCAPVSSKVDPAAPPAAASGGSSSSPDKSDGDDRTAKIGEWIRAADGLTWTVTKISATRVSQWAAGGHPGDPALVVSVRIKNGTKHRIDLTQVQVSVRTGADGDDAEQVFDVDAGWDGFDGTLAPGRTASAKCAFAVDSRKALRQVAIEVAPGFDYESGTFEGGV
jgi:hypothetical protein